MAKKENAIYAPGELSRVRDKLGVKDDGEAKRMAQLLGGEVGTEKSSEADKRNKKETVDVTVGKHKRRRIDVAMDDETPKPKSKRSGPYPGDDPSIAVRLSYSERIKMDQYSGQVIFEIKTSMQVLTSIFSFFRDPVDYVNPRFVVNRMNEYYHKIERLVTAARNLFPRSNKKRNNQLKRASPFVHKVLSTIRDWNIDQLAKDIAVLQAHPRAVKSTDFLEVLRGIYKPLFILDELSMENIKSAFKLVYKILYLESPMEAKEKYQDLIRNIILSFTDVKKNVQFGLYPILMKLISNRFITYERFFIERRNRYMAFLNVTEAIQLNADDLSPQQIETIDVEALQKEGDGEGGTDDEADDVDIEAEIGEEVTEEGEVKEAEEEDPNDPKVIERKAKEDSEKAQQKSLEQGRSALETIYPKAKWEKLDEFPDLYPYFCSIYNMRRGFELIAPTDPLQQIAVLLHILDDLFIGMRYVNFGEITGSDGKPVKVSDEVGDALNNWRRFIEDSFLRDYLPRLNDYCRMLENSEESRTTAYGRRTMNELHWIKRLYFLPYYKFESIGPPPFQKQDITPIYSEVRKLRKNLTAVAKGIELGIRAGGAASKAQCSGINNPWETYNFQVPNAVSKRLDIMLPQERKINATLIFFSLSTVTVLDFIVNNENSWAYGNRPGPIFRSVRDEGITPIFGVDDKIDADKLFKESLKK